MSPPSENVPRTPDRRSSTQALFTAFRTLTGGRLKSPTPPPSISSAVGTPARTPSLGTIRSASIASPLSADGTHQRISQIAGQKAGRPVTGGPPELAELIAQLDSNHPFPERAQAVDKICSILAEYPLENILGLWSVASDLLLPEQPDDVAEAGYKLLKGCASLPNLATIERNVFFDAASLRKNDRYFDKRLDVVCTLTKHGRDIEACESSIVPFVLSSMETCFQASHDAHKKSKSSRKANGKQSVDKYTVEAENMAQLFQYTIDICKFNAKVFTEDDLDLLLRRAVLICRGTTQASDVENCIRLFDTIITYVHVPMKSLRSCVEVLSEIHKQIPLLQDQTWSTLSNLLKSHVGQAAISSLLHTLLDDRARLALDDPDAKKRKYSLYKGTVEVLQRLLFENGRNELPRVPLSLLFPALKESIEAAHRTQEGIVISLINTVVVQDSTRELLIAETDLGQLLEIVSICAEREDNRQRARNEEVGSSSATTQKPSLERQLSPHEQGPRDHGMFFALFNPNTYSCCIGADSASISADTPSEPRPDQEAAGIPPEQEHTHLDLDEGLQHVLSELDRISDALDFVQREAVMRLLLRLSHRVSVATGEKVVQYFAEERYLHPANGDWLELSRSLVDGIIKDPTRPRSLRVLAIQTLRKTYDIAEHLCSNDAVLRCGTLLLDSIQAEEDVEILNELVDFAVDVAEHAPLAEFSDIVELLKKRLDRPRPLSANTAPLWQSHTLHPRDDHDLGSPSNVITTAYVRLFTRSVMHAAQKTRILYETLRAIAGSDKYEHDGRLSALKLLFRLRADSRHSLIVSSSSEGERIAAELCRTEETALAPEKVEEHVGDQSRSDDTTSSREQRKTSGSSPHSSLNRQTGRAVATAGRVSKPIPPLWMYPGPKGLPEEPTSEASRVVFSHIDASQYPLSDDVHDMEITLWLELIISLLQRPPDWEIYSYVLVHLGPQLSNQALVRSCVVQLRMLRNVLCEQVRNSSFHEPPPHTLLKKADVAVCLFHVLTVIISYHEYFEKSEEDDLVKAFLQGIVLWDRTSKWCIHALSVCCFEIPLSVSKSLDSIIQKMSQIITKPATAIHILEFLVSMARLPELFKNFREDEFKLVFGVCFRYLQHIRDQRERSAHASSLQNAHRTLRHSGPSRDFTASPDASVQKPRTVEDDLPQYLYSLAYHVITFWFMALKMEDRPKQIPWITRNLYHTDNHGKQILEEHGEVLVDIMQMVAYSDRDQTMRDENFAKLGDGEIWKKTWIVGTRLVTIETAARTGASIVTTRRPVSLESILSDH